MLHLSANAIKDNMLVLMGAVRVTAEDLQLCNDLFVVGCAQVSAMWCRVLFGGVDESRHVNCD